MKRETKDFVRNMIFIAYLGLALLIIIIIGLKEADAAIKTELTADGFNQPIFMTSPPDDDRLFVVEQTSGQIKIIKNGIVLTTPFIDLGSKIFGGGERGLLGLAFHPIYPDSNYFFVNYTRSGDGATVIARYSVSGNPDIADPASEQIIITIPQPASNHNGGMIAFGPNDGYLYLGMGDGGGSGDPSNRAQDTSQVYGKILRIDIDGDLPYSIPGTNPFVGRAGFAEEIWAIGVRNPWRWSFDRMTGDMYIGDVGQGAIEEIDFEPALSPGGINYGWRCYEGNNSYNTTGCLSPSEYTFPIYEYGHSSGRCSITGGYVYRGCAISDLQGTYFYGDFCTGEIWSFNFDGANITNFQNRTTELAPGGGRSIDNIVSFSEDKNGEIYIIDYDGEIFRIIPDGASSSCSYLCGDASNDGNVNILDITYIIAYIYQGGPAPDNIGSIDVNNDGSTNLLDITYLIGYIYQGNPAPIC